MPYHSHNCLPAPGVEPSTSSRMTSGRGRARQSGIVLVQVMVAMVIIVICGGAGIRALIEMNRKAAAMRALNQARAIVQSKLDYAAGLSFTKESVPTELAYTTGTDTQNVPIVVSRTDKNVINGTLRQIVSSVTAYPGDPDAPDIRKITYRITYNYRLKSYSYEMSSIRSTD